MSNNQKGSVMDQIKPFLFGGLSGCCATCTIQPIDTIKVRIQIVSEEKALKQNTTGPQRSTSPFKVAGEVYKQSGILGFYKGLDAAILRQVLYGTIRLGLFQYINDYFKDKIHRNMTMAEKSIASLSSGLIGAVVGNPADLALVRFQADTLAPPQLRRNYKHVFDALFRMVKEEGILTLWRGSVPTVLRAMLVNFGMMTTYEQIKEEIIKLTGNNSQSTRLLASFIAGINAAVFSLPADNVKTKLYKMRPGPDGKLPYKGTLDCFMKSIQREGFFKLWIGIETYIVRVSPHVIVSLLVMDFLNSHWGAASRRKQ